MPAIIVKGAIIVVTVVGAAAVAIAQSPEVRQLAENCRRKIAVALHNLGDEINPRPQQPRFNRPEDAEGFMQPHAASGEMDADDESRRRQREELMYWNAIKLQNLEKQTPQENKTKGPTFDDIVRKNSASKEEAYAVQTGAEIQEDEGTLRRRGERSRGIDRGSASANPFADENYLDSEGDAKMIAPEEDEVEDIYTHRLALAEDEVEDIYTDNDLKYYKRPVPDNRGLTATNDYPLGQRYTAQLKNSSIGMMHSQESPASQSPTNFNAQDYALGLEQENRERASQASQVVPPYAAQALPIETPELSYNSNPWGGQSSYTSVPVEPSVVEQPKAATSSNLELAAVNNEAQIVSSEEHRYENVDSSSREIPESIKVHGSENKRMRDQIHPLQDYQMQLMLLEQQNKKRRVMALQTDVPKEPEAYRGNNQANRTLQDYQGHPMQLEQQHKEQALEEHEEKEASKGKERETDNNNNPGPEYHCLDEALADKHMELKRLNKIRLMIARQKEDMQYKQDKQKQSGLGEPVRNHANQDYQMQLMLQNKKKLMLARQEQQKQRQSGIREPESSYANQHYQMQLMLLEQQNKRRLMIARQEQEQSSHKEPVGENSFQLSQVARDYNTRLELLEQLNRRRLMIARQENDMSRGKEPEGKGSSQPSQEAQEPRGFHPQPEVPDLQHESRNQMLPDYHMQLELLRQQDKAKLTIGRPEQAVMAQDSASSSETSHRRPATPKQEEREQLVDVSEPSSSIHLNSTPSTTNSQPASYQTSQSQIHSSNPFASIHAWADNSTANTDVNTSFYSPLPGTPRALSSVASEFDHLSQAGDMTPTDSVSLAGSGEDVDNDNASSVGGGRYDDVVSVDGGISTPGSWTEVGSVVSDDDASQR